MPPNHLTDLDGARWVKVLHAGQLLARSFDIGLTLPVVTFLKYNYFGFIFTVTSHPIEIIYLKNERKHETFNLERRYLTAL